MAILNKNKQKTKQLCFTDLFTSTMSLTWTLLYLYVTSTNKIDLDANWMSLIIFVLVQPEAPHIVLILCRDSSSE